MCVCVCLTWQESQPKQITVSMIHAVPTPSTWSSDFETLNTDSIHVHASPQLIQSREAPWTARGWDPPAANKRKGAGKASMAENVTGSGTLVAGSPGEAVHVFCQQSRSVTADTKIKFLSSRQQKTTQ